MSLDQMKEHCRQVLVLLVRGHRRMIETNFPTLSEQFNLYPQRPVRAILGLDPTFATRNRSVLAFCDSRSDADEVVVYDAEEAHFDLDSYSITTPDGTQTCQFARWLDAREFLYGRHMALEYECEESVLRSWIYRWIQEDFQAVKNSLATDPPQSENDRIHD